MHLNGAHDPSFWDFLRGVLVRFLAKSPIFFSSVQDFSSFWPTFLTLVFPRVLSFLMPTALFCAWGSPFKLQSGALFNPPPFSLHIISVATIYCKYNFLVEWWHQYLIFDPVFVISYRASWFPSVCWFKCVLNTYSSWLSIRMYETKSSSRQKMEHIRRTPSNLCI